MLFENNNSIIQFKMGDFVLLTLPEITICPIFDH